MTKQARIITKDLRRVYLNFPTTISEKLWHLDTWIYRVISRVIGSVRACLLGRSSLQHMMNNDSICEENQFPAQKNFFLVYF